MNKEQLLAALWGRLHAIPLSGVTQDLEKLSKNVALAQAYVLVIQDIERNEEA